MSVDAEIEAIRKADQQVISQTIGHLRTRAQANVGEIGKPIGGIRAAILHA